MTLQYVIGDPSLTQAQTLAFSYNNKGQTEMGAIQTHLMQRYPVAFASYGQRCRKGRIPAGSYFIWRESIPQLMFMAVRDSAGGTTRLRHVQACVLALSRDYQQEGLRSLAIAPLSQPHEWDEVKKVLETWFSRVPIPVIVYDEYVSGIKAEEPDLT